MGHLEGQNKGKISVAATTSATRSSGRASKARSFRNCPYPGCKEVHPVWWNEAKNGWYLTVRDPSRPRGQRQDRLAKGWEGHDEAIQSWHESEANRASEAAVHRFGEDMKVGDLCNLFLANLEPKLSPKRFRITKGYLTDLTVSLGAETIGELRIGGVARIEKWMAAHTGWNSTSTSRSVVSRVKQLFKWGADQGFIISSPVRALKRGSDEVRVAIFSAKQVAAILKEANPAFATVFKVLLLTGCRPDELCRATAHDLEEDGGLHRAADGQPLRNLAAVEQRDRQPGAGLDGEFTTGTSAFENNGWLGGTTATTVFGTGSGDGLAGGDFDFYFSVLPGDANQNGTVNASDSNLVKLDVNLHSTQAGYNPFYDLDGNGTINASDSNVIKENSNRRLNVNSPPALTSAGGAVGGADLTQLALAISESSATASSQATDSAVAQFDLSDLWV